MRRYGVMVAWNDKQIPPDHQKERALRELFLMPKLSQIISLMSLPSVPFLTIV